MPSFCPPVVFGPKPWMTLPRTGQRRLTEEFPVAPVGAVSGSGSAAGATMLALGGASALATFEFCGLATGAVSGLLAICGAACAGFGCTAGAGAARRGVADV